MMKWPLYLIIFVNSVAISLLAMGFFANKPAEYATIVEPRSAGECGLVRPKVRLKNLVIFVLDAFRDEFFFKFDTMRRTRSLVERGDAIAFRAHAYHPTVTLPRLKSIMSGTIPTFSDLITNFASGAFAEDNILTKAKKAHKRLVFYGDDTWLSMFPDADFFEPRSEGVSSFYAMDYTEVDNNVTRHLDRELTSAGLDSWDILTLHYLGLDHIGHSIGGEAPEIHVKLDEMDQIIYNMTQALSRHRAKPGEFAILILGDHGMTLGGGHGGSSPHETRVPVIFVKQDAKGLKKEMDNLNVKRKRQAKPNKRFLNVVNKHTGEMEPAGLIEQVDIAPTIAALLDFDRPPASNLGVSFHAKIEENWRFVAAKIRANVQQFVHVFSNFQSTHFRLKDDIMYSLNVCLNRTAALCHTREDKRVSSTASLVFRECEQAMRRSQHEIMGKVTGNSNEYLVISIVLCFLALIFSVPWAFGLKLQLFEFNIYKLAMLQPILMFSSSFVEEEHDIWYFLLSLFILKVMWDDLRLFYGIIGRELHTTKLHSLRRAVHRERWLLIALVLNRLGRSTFDGKRRRWLLFESDKLFDFGLGILRAEYFHPFITFIFSEGVQVILATVKVFLMNMSFIYRNSTSLHYNCIPASIGFVAVFLYKLPLGFGNFVFLQRTVQFFLIWLFVTKNFSLAFSLWLMFVMKASLLHLFLQCWGLGFAIGKVKIANVVDVSFLLHTAMCSAFYYTGNTNMVSSIDIAPGYAGLTTYSPIIVGIQILLNGYAGPICVFLGWYYSINQHSTNTLQSNICVEDIIPLFTMLRCAVLLSSLFMNLHFRDHIFIWTIFAPKMLYEIVHFAVFSLFAVFAFSFSSNERRISKNNKDTHAFDLH